MASVRAWSLVCRAFVLIVVPTIGVADEGMTFNKDELLRKGYSLDRETMRAILKEGKTSVPFCLGFIAEQNYSDLTPDVKAYRARLNLEDYVDSCNWCSATECLFQIDKDMSREEVKSSVEVIRQELFQKGWKSEPFESYEALLAAERWKGVDIKDDLLRLASGHTVRFNIRSPIGRLFDLYGAQLTEVDIRPILDAWAGDTKISRYVRRKAEAVGIALPPEVVQGQGGDQSKETAPPTSLDGSVLVPSRSLTEWTKDIKVFSKTSDSNGIQDANAGVGTYQRSDSTQKIVVICMLGTIAAFIILGDALYRRYRRRHGQ